ncbi:MAG: HAD family hydrolase [Spirochaetales bacterium]|nr:HAD family hydrolase [Spirochaetales bacterium]
MAIKAVAFDIDGTLYPNRRMMFHSIPFLLSHFTLVKEFNEARKDLRELEDVSHFRQAQAELFAKRMNISLDEAVEIIEKVFYTKWELIFKRVRPFIGLQRELENLKARGLKLGVMSDFPVGKKLEYFAVDGHWDVTMSSEETGYLKPHIRPFEVLAEKLGCRPEEVIYVGNSYKYDMVGASAAGMKTVYVNWKGKKIPEADLTITNFRHFSRDIAFLLEGE